jgi:hypothetical protein
MAKSERIRSRTIRAMKCLWSCMPLMCSYQSHHGVIKRPSELLRFFRSTAILVCHLLSPFLASFSLSQSASPITTFFIFLVAAVGLCSTLNRHQFVRNGGSGKLSLNNVVFFHVSTQNYLVNVSILLLVLLMHARLNHIIIAAQL